MKKTKRKRSGRRAGSFRTCIGCRDRLPRESCLRLTLDAQGTVWPDLYQRMPGRGAHLCPNLECISQAAERNAFSRAFRARVESVDPLGLAGSFIEGGRGQVASMLATALRSGWLQAGRSVVGEHLQAGRTALVLLAEDASAALTRDMKKQTGARGVPCHRLLSQEEMGRYHNGKPLAVIGIGHRGMASRLRKLLDRTVALMESTTKWHENHRQELTGRMVRGKMPPKQIGNDPDR